MSASKRYALTLLVGFLGALLFFTGWHIWNDHVLFHELVQIETMRQRALPKPEAPRAPGS